MLSIASQLQVLSSDYQFQISRKRYRGSDSPNDSDEQIRTPPGGAPLGATYLNTPPPSSPPKGATTISQAQVQGVRDYTFVRQTARDVYLGCIRKQYPNLDIANLTDFQVMMLSSGDYKGPTAGIQQWLKDELALVVKFLGEGEQAILDMATKACDEKVAAIGVSSASSKLSVYRVTDRALDRSAQALGRSNQRFYPTSDEYAILHAPLAGVREDLVFRLRAFDHRRAEEQAVRVRAVG